MAKKEKPNGMITQNAELPAFMQQNLEGTELLQQFITPPRLKIVQKMSGKPFSDMFNPGDVVVMPMTIQVAPIQLNESGRPTDKGTPFHFVPIFFYPEWCVWNPLECRGQLPAIRERTIDAQSSLAIKSRSPSTWSFPCPEKADKDCRIVEHLNFIVVILPPNEIEGIPVVMSFARAEHKGGSNLAALIKMRKAPIYGCVFAARVGYRENAKGNWFGFDVSNPDSIVQRPFIDVEETFNYLKLQHAEYKKAYEAGLIRADYDDEVSSVAPATAEF